MQILSISLRKVTLYFPRKLPASEKFYMSVAMSEL
jgi:hypothetical protein